MDDAVGEGERHADQQRQRGLAVADRPHVLRDHAVGLALEGQQRPADRRDRPPAPALDRRPASAASGARSPVERIGLPVNGSAAGPGASTSLPRRPAPAAAGAISWTAQLKVIIRRIDHAEVDRVLGVLADVEGAGAARQPLEADRIVLIEQHLDVVLGIVDPGGEADRARIDRLRAAAG